MDVTVQTFRQFLDTAFENGQYTTDDVIAFVMPLFKEVLSFHEAGLVAPFDGEEHLFITDGCIDIDEAFAHAPLAAAGNVQALFKKRTGKSIEIVDVLKVSSDIESGKTKWENMSVHFNTNEPFTGPAYTQGYRCFETLVGHHDALSDIFSLGLVMGSVAMGLDLYQEDDLNQFVAHRHNPSALNSKIHPTITSLISEMTALDRVKRTQDLYEVIEKLEHYRDFDPEKQKDLSNEAGWINKELGSRSEFILNKLRNRLFDTSRRNRLLYYRPNMRFVNLTISSVPMVLHYQSIRAERLFTWNKDILNNVKKLKDILLNKYLRFEDHHYLSSSLNKIRVEAQRDINEYGFSQLKLVITFLNWHNLKESPNERIQSPLLLIPVELKRNKRIKEDHFVVKILDNEAEVNPVLSNHLRDLYGIKLPDFVDLNEINLEDFYTSLKNQIDAVNQGISLNLIDKPRIKLIHTEAKKTVVNFKKRLRKRGQQLSSYKNLSFSYQQENYKPLGLEIFRQYIEPRVTFLEFLINEDILPSHYNWQEPTKTRKLYELANSEENPYSWDFDICNIVLGNFNYKKMSLVRDYNQVMENKLSHEVFEDLFSNEPKPLTEERTGLQDMSTCYHVVTADPTQTNAVLKSRSGNSYIIQGPPGTGKSQTITNLISDFVAQGKSVLFVCEKRAALDVVYYRLKQQGLEELCCYIHDSQGDKRSFIQNLKATYEDFIGNRIDIQAIEDARKNVLDNIQKQLQLISHFHETSNTATETTGIEIRRLIERIISLHKNLLSFDSKEEEILAHYADWLKIGSEIHELSTALVEAGAEPAFAEHPFSKINHEIFGFDKPLTVLEERILTSRNLLEVATQTIVTSRIFADSQPGIEEVKKLVDIALVIQPLAESNSLKYIFDPRFGRDFDFQVNEYLQYYQKHQAIIDKNKNWRVKFDDQDTTSGISIASQHEASFFGFFSGAWRSLKKKVNDAYDFSSHQVKPTYLAVLQNLKEEYESEKMLVHKRERLQQQLGVLDINDTIKHITAARAVSDTEGVMRLIQAEDPKQAIAALCTLKAPIEHLKEIATGCLQSISDKSLQQIGDELESIEMNLEALPDLLPALRDFVAMPDQVKATLTAFSLTPEQAEANMAFKTLSDFYRSNKKFNNTDYQTIEKAAREIGKSYQQLLKLNARYIRASIRKQFVKHMEISNMALSQLERDQREFKKQYSEGRKILENEFNKSMRYKSIRELAGKESGMVLRDLKPVWLMSPLSVSDSLPLDVNYFDAIIFDEASQITLEEGIPALCRAPQTIIVGDDKQMPPSNFFTAKAEDPDDLDVQMQEGLEEILSNEVDSLLVQGARKLDSIMLGWHYRSRYETLISYSNHAFYNASLLTIPDKTIHHTMKEAIEVSAPEQGAQYADALFDRSISFHYHPSSVYEKRTNLDEANYIAHLVREILTRDVEESIGLVAFSQEQQHTLEDALLALAATDKEFELKLEEAYNRTEEDQFVGLFVKNLENVQGDERDIIIMSVCYGFDSRRKMIMNFGPINKKGGEKRLNVIFSRAKKHMAVVSSIKHADITNEYNEGANYFKRFLQYAELISSGHTEGAGAILEGLVVEKSNRIYKPEKSVVLDQIREALTNAGYEVTAHVGQSRFKCSLAVKLNPSDTDYTLGVLIDDDLHYSNQDMLEQYYQRPEVLQAFGWRVIQVFSKDWLHQKDKVMKYITRKLHEEPVKTLEMEEETEVFPAAAPVLENRILEEQVAQEERRPAFNARYDHLDFTSLVFKDNKSKKFWEAAVEERKLVVRFGRIGTRGQMQFKTFTTEEEALAEKAKLVREKLNKGYQNVDV